MTSAWPIDLYRLLVGLMGSVYFLQAMGEFADFSSHDGVLDHEMVRRIFWFTTLNYIQNETHVKLALGIGFSACLAVAIGWRARLCALVALVAAVGYFRWIFPVGNLNDTSMQMHLFWVALLPVGFGLRPRTRMVSKEMLTIVFGNLFVLYLVTGLSKWQSPLWRDGFALYCILRSPLSRTSGWWGVDHLPWTAALNWLAMLVEPLLPFLLLLPPGHRWKWVGGACWLGLHAGILVTIGVEYANVGLLLALVLAFREELSGVSDTPPTTGKRSWLWRMGVVYLILLTLAMSQRVPVVEKLRSPAFATLWLGGLVQEYHLFDWIDEYNYVMTCDPYVFPPGLRGFVLQVYLQDRRWMHMPRELMGELQRSLWAGLRRRTGVSEVECTFQQLGPANLNLDRGRLARFELPEPYREPPAPFLRPPDVSLYGEVSEEVPERAYLQTLERLPEIEKREGRLGPNVARAYARLGRLSVIQDNPRGALPHLLKSLETLPIVKGWTDPLTIQTVGYTVEAYLRTGDREAARRLAARVWAQLSQEDREGWQQVARTQLQRTR